MFKLMTIRRCAFCTIPEKTSPQNVFISVKNNNNILRSLNSYDKRLDKRKKFSQENANAIKAILQKYNINIENITRTHKFFLQSPWLIDKQILLLQELGVPTINTKHLINFSKVKSMSVNIFKANFEISPEVNLAEKLLSYAENSKIDLEELSHLNESMIMRDYYSECLVYYIKKKLDFNEQEANNITFRKHSVFTFNSFKLLNVLLKFLKNEIMFNNPLLAKNRWIFGLHPEHTEIVYKMLLNNFGNNQIVIMELLRRNPKTLQYDNKQLKILLDHLNSFNVTEETLLSHYRIFSMSPAEFQRRADNLLKNPFTTVYHKHPKFLSLVRDYHILLPRIRYLEENNLKFATIHTLTTFHNYLEQLVNTRKLNKTYLKSFFEFHFGEQNVEILLYRIRKHPYCFYVPLVQMLETLQYLKENFSIKLIEKHIYAILYNKTDIQITYESLMNDSNYSKMPSQRILPLCIYKIEEKCHFTGEGVLTTVNTCRIQTELNERQEKEL